MFNNFVGNQPYRTYVDSPVIMFAGDSITAGTGSTSTGGFKGAFIDSMQNYYGVYPRPTIDVVGSTWIGNYSFPCCGYPGVKAAQLNSTYLTPDLTAYNPNYVFLHIGSNDIFFSLPISGIKADISLCLDTIRNACPEAIVFLSKIIDANDPTWSADIIDLNVEIEDLANSRTDSNYIVLLDPYTVLGTWDASRFFDDKHPNTTGYNLMGNYFFENFKNYYTFL